MRNKWMIVIAVLLAMTVLLTACGGSAAVPRPTPSAAAEGEEAKPMVPVEGSCTAEQVGNTLIVRAQTNLMDGINGLITVNDPNGMKVDEVKITKEGDNLEHTFTIEEDWPAEVYGFVTFGPNQGDKQPAEVTDAYGKKFEYLEGDDSIILWDNKAIVVVLQSEKVTLS